MEIEAIAHIHTGFPEKFGIPRQSGLVEEAEGRIVFVPKYRQPDALRGIREYDYLWLIWDFSENHRTEWCATVAPPRLGGRERVGVFASRSPFRPNPLGLSCVKIREVDEEACEITVSGVDMLDGTPIYDIKPYLPYADAHPEARGGFSDVTKEHALSIRIPAELEEKLTPEERAAVTGILKQDPRTAFIHDEERVWGVSYGALNVRFRVRGGEAEICEITRGGNL
ncbi:MAG: tRNA (N6-threonylcarbamoyladenosine(37)-N6)-methyltransferase TrmO [Lachnospiraceae bacterium]|nr:tRNA (N6-threonylcarbamoyladenosine(37)-N6)-methyltransferase TrmO [Lachnospiraceae bacterium]